jgi:hypothetical protein
VTLEEISFGSLEELRWFSYGEYLRLLEDLGAQELLTTSRSMRRMGLFD